MSDTTLTAAIERFREQGYTVDLRATPDGMLACDECHGVEAPESMTIDHTVRFEGASDPGDSSILVAVTCECGFKGLFSAAYGAATPAAESAVLTRLAQRRRDEQR